MGKNYDGWVFKWIRSADGGPGFMCKGTFSISRRGVISRVVGAANAECSSRQKIWRQYYDRGGRVVKVELVEVKP